MVPSTSADLWHLRLGHLNYPDMCKLKNKATSIDFVGEPCFCQTCVKAKMRRTPFQNKGEMSVAPKQNICFDVPGLFLHQWKATLIIIHSMQYAKLRGSGGGKEVKLSQKLLLFLLTLCYV